MKCTARKIAGLVGGDRRLFISAQLCLGGTGLVLAWNWPHLASTASGGFLDHLSHLWMDHQIIFLSIGLFVALQSALLGALLIANTRRKRSEHALDERLRFERLISELSAAFVDPPIGTVDQEIVHALEKVRAAVGLDRCLLFDYHIGTEEMQITHHSESPGTSPLRPDLDPSMLPWFFDQIRHRRTVSLDDVQRDLPPEAASERQFASANQIVSVLVMPIRHGRDSMHGIAYHSTRRPQSWPEDLKSRLHLIGEVLISSLAAVRAEAAVRASEERYREVVESQTELVCRYLPDTTLTFVNEAYCRFFRRNREDLLNRKFLDLIPESAHEAVRDHIAALTRDRRVTTQEHEVVLPDGSIGWQQWIDYAINAQDGRVTECQGIGRDITGRKRMEEALRASEERMSLAADAANLVFWYWDTVTDEMWLTEKGRLVFDLDSANGLRYQSFLMRVHPDDRGALLSTVGESVSRNHDLETEFRIVRSDGNIRWIHSRGRCVPKPGSQGVRLSGVSTDITEKKRADEALRNLTHTTRLAIVGELTASIAHEINQPLGAILSNADAAEMLLESNKPSLEELRKILADIRKDDLRASQVIRQIRDLLRKREVQMSAVNLNGIVEETVSLVAPDARQRKVSFDAALSPSLPPIFGDRIHLQQVLLNLILNGMDAMNEISDVERRILLRTHRADERYVEVTVSDTGHGISSDTLPHIFDSFFTTKETGIGLGLALARSIIETHNGRIFAENNTERGATFRIHLPVFDEFES